jgi:hypothetical protein
MASARHRALLVALLSAAAACKGDEKRGLELASRDGGPPVVIVDEPVGGGAPGPVEREVEPNDQRDQAAALRLPGGVSGALAGPDDIDFYRIEAGPARVVALRASGAAADEGGVDLVLELHDGDGKPIARSDRGPAGALEGLPNAPLARDAAYFVSVGQFVKKGRSKKKKKKGAETEEAAASAGAASAYQLTIEMVSPAAEEEAEPNDEAAEARPVLLGEERTGYLGWSKDQDVWKLSLEGFSGGFALDVAVDAVEGVPLALDLLAPDGRVLAARKGQKDRGLQVRGLLPELGVPFYLARVSSARSNPEQTYRLRPTSRSLTDTDEAEPNDDPEHAIAAGALGDGVTGERRGFLDGGDSDVYKFEVGREALGLTVSVEPPASADVVLRVLGPGGAELASADGGKAGQREEIAGLAVGRGEVRFVVVTGSALGDEADGYLLRWSSAVNLPGQPAPAGQPPADSPDQPPPVDDPYEQ